MAVRRSMGRRVQASCSHRVKGCFYSAAQPTLGVKVNARKVRSPFHPCPIVVPPLAHESAVTPPPRRPALPVRARRRRARVQGGAGVPTRPAAGGRAAATRVGIGRRRFATRAAARCRRRGSSLRRIQAHCCRRKYKYLRGTINAPIAAAGQGGDGGGDASSGWNTP